MANKTARIPISSAAIVILRSAASLSARPTVRFTRQNCRYSRKRTTKRLSVFCCIHMSILLLATWTGCHLLFCSGPECLRPGL